MVWFNVDDGLSTSPKVLGIPRAQRLQAMGLWTLAGSWCGKHLTDGAVPAFMIEEWGADAAGAQVLVDAGLWRETAKGYQFHDWKAYQQSRAEVEEKREADRERKRRYRAGKADQKANSPEVSPEGVPPGQDAGRGEESATPFPTLPNPSLPNPSHPINKPSSPRGDALFAEFYMAYPRKVGKEAARKKFLVLAKKTDPQLIVAGARRFAADPNLPEDKTFIPHPATWLNAGQWEDEPMPPRGGRSAPPNVEPGQEWMSR